MSHNTFNSLQSFDLGNGKEGKFYSLPALAEAVGMSMEDRVQWHIDTPKAMMAKVIASICHRVSSEQTEPFKEPFHSK